MRIGILGGSFDPIHNGHLHMAKSAYGTGNFDEIWLMPGGHSPHKEEKNMTSAKERFAMTELAAKEYPFLKACDYEVKKEQTCYTYLTMEELTQAYPEDEFSFIMGADSLHYFDKWRNPQIIASLCRIFVINRGEFTHTSLEEKITQIQSLFPADIQVISCEKYHISSSEIRRKLADNMDCTGNLPQAVLDYIKKKKLYCKDNTQ